MRLRFRLRFAAELYISIRTVRSHLDRIRDKTGCRRRADLTRMPGWQITLIALGAALVAATAAVLLAPADAPAPARGRAPGHTRQPVR